MTASRRRGGAEGPSWTRRAESSLEDTELEGTPYRKLGSLARGGMGEVVEAEHVALAKRVVVKLLHKDLAVRPDLVDRMRVEAQTLSRLQHPNLVAVSDLGQNAEGRPYLVMERLVGRTLREELAARGVLPVGEAIDYARQALAGLAAAHRAGVVHRDVKLDNLFLCEADAGRRVVKLLDFGIAKVLAGGGGLAPAPLEYSTETHEALGTPRFLAPEQAQGGAIDARADVYAMGAVLYELIAGRGPFDHHKKAANLLLAHALETPLPPSRHAPQPIPEELDAVVLRALAKRPEDRFAGADAFAAALPRMKAPPRWAATEKMDGVEQALELAKTRVRATPEPAIPAKLAVLEAVIAANLAKARAKPPVGAVTASDLAVTRPRVPVSSPAPEAPPGPVEPPRFRDPFQQAALGGIGSRRARPATESPPSMPAAVLSVAVRPPSARSGTRRLAVIFAVVALAVAAVGWLAVRRLGLLG